MVHPNALEKMFSYNAELINKQTVGMVHEESLQQVPFNANNLNWILGHIISARTMALQIVGETAVWSEGQRASYRHGSRNIGADDEGLIRLEDLLIAFNLSQERLLKGLSQMSYDDMCRPSGYRENTIGDSLAYFQFHETHHIGQIIYLAQFVGKDGVWIS